MFSFSLSSSDERDRVQKKTFTKWINQHLLKVRTNVCWLFVRSDIIWSLEILFYYMKTHLKIELMYRYRFIWKLCSSMQRWNLNNSSNSDVFCPHNSQQTIFLQHKQSSREVLAVITITTFHVRSWHASIPRPILFKFVTSHLAWHAPLHCCKNRLCFVDSGIWIAYCENKRQMKTSSSGI